MSVNLAGLHADCPKCGEKLWRERRGEYTLRAAILKVGKDGQMVARCSRDRCDGEVAVPWLKIEAPPATEPARPRLGIRRRLAVDSTRA